jgi:hypothetical protein
VKAAAFYRVASGLLLLFAIAHSIGFWQSDPSWSVGAVLGSMRSSQFTIQGFTRTYWDFFLGAGFTVGLLFLFASVLAWQLGGLRVATLASMRFTTWSFATCFFAITALSWRYLFWIPIVMSGVIAVCLAAAAWSAGRVADSGGHEKASSRAGA